MKPEDKLFKIIAVVKTEFYGSDKDRAVRNMIQQAETMNEEDWTIIDIIEIPEEEK